MILKFLLPYLLVYFRMTRGLFNFGCKFLYISRSVEIFRFVSHIGKLVYRECIKPCMYHETTSSDRLLPTLPASPSLPVMTSSLHSRSSYFSSCPFVLIFFLINNFVVSFSALGKGTFDIPPVGDLGDFKAVKS